MHIMRNKHTLDYFILAFTITQTLAVFSTLDDTNTKVIDTFVSKYLGVLTVKKINQSLIEQGQLEHQCVSQINQTVDQCITCTNNCGAQISLPSFPGQSGASSSSLENNLKNVLTGVLLGSPDIGVALGEIALHGVDHIAGELAHGVDHLTHEIGHGVEHLTHELNHGIEHLAHELQHGAEHVAHEIGHGVEHVAHELGHLAHGAEGAIKDVGHGVEHVAHEVEHGINHIGHEIHHIFGKREKDCDLECPMCKKVRNNDTNAVQLAVCGSAYISRIKQLESLVPKFKQIAWAIKTQTIVNKVEYDPVSLDTSGGAVQFLSVYLTANINGSPFRFKANAAYQMMNSDASSKQWAEQILNLFLL